MQDDGGVTVAGVWAVAVAGVWAVAVAVAVVLLVHCTLSCFQREAWPTCKEPDSKLVCVCACNVCTTTYVRMYSIAGLMITAGHRTKFGQN